MDTIHRTHFCGFLSVVVAAHDQAPELKRNLPLLLALHYEPGYEVIVVDESSTDDTQEVLKQIATEHPALYTTYIPSSSHYVSRRKLALTIGIKAAKSQWVLLTDANCHPDSTEWLSVMAESMTDEADIVCGYTNFDPTAKGCHVYLRMLNWWRNKWHPYRHDGANLAVRKASFMEHNGFLKNLKYMRGEYDFLVNEAQRQRIAIACSPDSRMRQEELPPAQWTAHQLNYMNIRPALRHAFLQRLAFVLWQGLLHLSYLLAVAAIVFFAIRQHVVGIALSASFLVFLLATRTIFGYRLAKAYGEHIAFWKLPWLDLGVAWHYAYYWLRYMVADKDNFIRK